MYERGCVKNLFQRSLDEKSTPTIPEGNTLSQYKSLIAEEAVNFRILQGTMVWLDVISAITAGTAPRLLFHHSRVIGPTSEDKLEDLMGCKNWVMLQIGRIAALHQQKIQALQQENLDCTEIEQVSHDISKGIQCGLNRESVASINISGTASASELSTVSDSSTLITHIFAYMALVYLHLVIHGFQNLEILETTTSKALRMLQTQILPSHFPALVCPLYFFGSVAAQGDEELFRNIFTCAPLLDPVLKHRKRILPLLEDVWLKRRLTHGLSWEDSLVLAKDVLLV